MTKQNRQLSTMIEAAGLVGTGRLEQIGLLAEKTGLSLDRVMLSEGVLPQTLLNQCLKAQAMVEASSLHEDIAVQGLVICKEQAVSLEIALNQLEWDGRQFQLTCKLGELLMAAGCISQQQLGDALEICVASGIPLAKILVMREAVNENVSYAALTAQVLIREQKMNLQEAVTVISDVGKGASITTALSGHMSSKVRLGELLLCAGLITDMQLLSAVEKALTLDCKIGEVLVRDGYLGQRHLEAALKAQDGINRKLISLAEGLEHMSKVEASNGDLAGHDKMVAPPPVASLPFAPYQPGGGDADLQVLIFELRQQRENLAFRIVNEQEELKQSIARELHDTIIADLMMLRRYLSGDKVMSLEEHIQIVDHITNQLRDLCYDFSPPRHLKDVGLLGSIEDLLARTSGRTAIKCDFTCQGTLPDLPEPVKLHIFRIVQESLNNTLKYSEATSYSLSVSFENDQTLRICARDNGKGFESGEVSQYRRDGGSGLKSLQDRTALLRVYYPARLNVEALPGAGTAITLEMQITRIL